MGVPRGPWLPPQQHEAQGSAAGSMGHGAGERGGGKSGGGGGEGACAWRGVASVTERDAGRMRGAAIVYHSGAREAYSPR